MLANTYLCRILGSMKSEEKLCIGLSCDYLKAHTSFMPTWHNTEFSLKWQLRNTASASWGWIGIFSSLYLFLERLIVSWQVIPSILLVSTCHMHHSHVKAMSHGLFMPHISPTHNSYVTWTMTMCRLYGLLQPFKSAMASIQSIVHCKSIYLPTSGLIQSQAILVILVCWLLKYSTILNFPAVYRNWSITFTSLSWGS